MTLWEHAHNWALSRGLSWDEADAYAAWFDSEFPNGEGLTTATSHTLEYAYYVNHVTTGGSQ